MPIRFTDFLKYKDEDINLYFIEESAGSDVMSFRVQAKDHESVTFRMFKKGENVWTDFPQDAPKWVTDLEPLLSQVLEQRLQKF
jgi:hypothetical protein